MVDNPRFPHWCRITRKTAEGPLEDEDDFTPLPDRSEEDSTVSDDDFDPLASDEETVQGSVSGDGDTTDATATEEPVSEEPAVVANAQSVVIYEGVCRSYQRHTTSDRGEVITPYRGLALPLTQDDWNALGVIPQEGDELAVDHGVYQEYGRVIDRNPANFHGTHLTWRYGRN